MTKHVPHFEVLRGLAALWVFFSHVLMVVDGKVLVLSRGDLAVEVFILLSGFVITLMRLNEDEPYGAYIFRRLMRLYPAFLIALLLGMLTSSLYPEVFGAPSWGDEPREGFLIRKDNELSFFWTHLWLHLSLFHGVVPDSVLPQAPLMFSGPLWSISLEWQFYLIAPVCIFALNAKSPKRLALALGFVLVVLFLEHIVRWEWKAEVPSFLPLQLDLFVVGIVSALLWKRARSTDEWTLAIAIVLAGIVASAIAPHKLPLLIWFATYYAAAVGDKVLVGRVAMRLCCRKEARLLGTVSYGFYVFHLPLILVAAAYVVIPLTSDYSRVTAAAFLVAVVLPLALLLAWVCHRWIERPAIRWARDMVRQLFGPNPVNRPA